jgi:hypothetical protein
LHSRISAAISDAEGILAADWVPTRAIERGDALSGHPRESTVGRSANKPLVPSIMSRFGLALIVEEALPHAPARPAVRTLIKMAPDR